MFKSISRYFFRTWESLEFRVVRNHEIVGSNPTVLTSIQFDKHSGVAKR